MSAFNAGVTAYDKGELMIANPFDAEIQQESLAWEWWREGWKFAQRQSMMQTEADVSVFAKGKETFETGNPLTSVPYTRGTEQWLQWRRGWLMACWEAQDSSQGGE